MRVRRAFAAIPAVTERMKNKKLYTAVPIFFARRSNLITRDNLRVDEKRRAGGSLLNFRYILNKNWWSEITTGIETDHATFTGDDPFKASRTGFDDIVFAGGYCHFFDRRSQSVLYGIAGIPTRRKVTREDRYGPFVGSRFINVGCGAEFSHSFISELKHSFSAIVQTRFIHGLNRSWFPILPKNSEIQPGNFTDVLGVLQYRRKRTLIEAGYDATIFSHQAIVLPSRKIKTGTFVRHSGYISAAHLWKKGLFCKPFAVGAGINISDTNRFEVNTFTGWLFFTMIF